MPNYTLTWRRSDRPAPTDGSALRPDVLCALSSDDVKEIPIRVGRVHATIADFFDVAIDEGASTRDGCRLTLRSAPPLDRLGAAMQAGELFVVGDAGDDLGASMIAGFIRVTGSAGAHVGAPDVGHARGMTGGVILVDGDAGDNVGLRMRGGLIAVAGRCGRSPGYRTLAGTVVVGQGPLDYPGLEMRRGTILCLDAAAKMVTGPSFTDDGVVDAAAIPAISVLLNELRQLGWPSGATAQHDAERRSCWWRLLSGDRFELHRGEVIQCLS